MAPETRISTRTVENSDVVRYFDRLADYERACCASFLLYADKKLMKQNPAEWMQGVD